MKGKCRQGFMQDGGMWRAALKKVLFKLNLERRQEDRVGSAQTWGLAWAQLEDGRGHIGEVAGGPFWREWWKLWCKGPCLLPTRVKLPDKILDDVSRQRNLCEIPQITPYLTNKFCIWSCLQL